MNMADMIVRDNVQISAILCRNSMKVLDKFRKVWYSEYW